MASPSRPQTLKQAKAAYKSRTNPVLTEREKKQLERSLELDRRAWRVKEGEKKKAEAARKRAEKEREEREGRRMGMGMGPRKCDRFGFVGSQMGLGAFLGGRGEGEMAKAVLQDTPICNDDEEGGEFVGDAGVCGMVVDPRPSQEQAGVDVDVHNWKPSNANRSPKPRSKMVNPPQAENGMLKDRNQPTAFEPKADDELESVWDELESLWDGLESSTQIARDLAADAPIPRKSDQTVHSCASFGSDFDLSIEEIEELEKSSEKMQRRDRTLMPPPPLPATQQPTSAKVDATRPSGPRALEHGFTTSELELLIDDDLQLTQAEPG